MIVRLASLLGTDFLVHFGDEELQKINRLCRSCGKIPSAEHMTETLKQIIRRGIEEELGDVDTVEALAREHGESE